MEVVDPAKEPLEIGQKYKISWSENIHDECTCIYEEAGIYIFRCDNGDGFMIGVGTKNGEELFFPASRDEFGAIELVFASPLHLFTMYESGMLKGGTKSRRKTKKRRRAYGSKSHRNRARISSRR